MSDLKKQSNPSGPTPKPNWNFKIFFIGFVFLSFLLAFTIGGFVLGSKNKSEDKFCGGIAANLPENQCPTGFKCKLDGNYPDASGKCVKE